MKFDLFPVVSTIIELNRSSTKMSRIPNILVIPVFVYLIIDLQPIWWLFFVPVFHLEYPHLSEPEWIKLCVWIEVYKVTPVMASVLQIAINPQMPKIRHPMNHLDRWSNLLSNREVSPAMGPSSQGRWRFIGNHRLCWDRRIKRESFLKEIEELRQVYNLQLMQVTEHKFLLNCKFPIATTKGSGIYACIKYDWL